MDKSFDGALDAVTNGRFLLIGMQKKKKIERVRDMTRRITSSRNTTSIFFFAIAGQCWLPRMLKSCNFSSAIFFPFGDENLKIPRPWLTRSFHVAQRIRGGLICLSLDTRIGPMKYFFRKKEKENVDLRHVQMTRRKKVELLPLLAAGFFTTFLFVTISMRSSAHVPPISQRCCSAWRANNWQKNKRIWTDLAVNSEFTPCPLLCSSLCANLTIKSSENKHRITESLKGKKNRRFFMFIAFEGKAEMSNQGWSFTWRDTLLPLHGGCFSSGTCELKLMALESRACSY